MHSSKTQNNLFVVDAGEKWAFHHISTPLFHNIFLRGHSKVSNLQSLPKEKEKEKASELSLRICLWVVLSTPIYQNCVENFLPRYCFSIL
jgi:hypothetical protein